MLLNSQSFIDKYSATLENPERILSYPEKILQFGTGVLLRGLPDYFVDRANKNGTYKGRIVVVKTTGTSAGTEFSDQANLFTQLIKGYSKGQFIEEEIINASISTVLHSNENWDAILEKAATAEINVIISNTTEQGLVYEKDDIEATPPKSFPAKLLACLIKRYEVLGDTEASEMVVVPTELLDGNGKLLKSIIDKHLADHNVDQQFVDWMNSRVVFCNSLVDRIVPGKPDASIQEEYEKQLGYEDKLMIVSEPYSLWAIEGPESIKAKLGFFEGNEGIKITDNIAVFKELKLRLLNATHTFCAGIAIQSGMQTVAESMQDKDFEAFITGLTKDISDSIAYDIDEDVKSKFASDVLDRFRNPNIKHYWKSIIFSYTEKFKIRCIPLMKEYYRKNGKFPESMIQGLSAYFMTSIPEKSTAEGYFTEAIGIEIKLNDPYSEKLYSAQLSNGDIATINDYIANYFLSGEPQAMINELQNLCVDTYQQIS